jgi:hypothetical protein
VVGLFPVVVWDNIGWDDSNIERNVLMTNDPRKQISEELKFTKCQDDTNCHECDKLQWCTMMEARMSLMRNQITYLDGELDQVRESRSDAVNTILNKAKEIRNLQSQVGRSMFVIARECGGKTQHFYEYINGRAKLEGE